MTTLVVLKNRGVMLRDQQVPPMTLGIVTPLRFCLRVL
jgi:hypothetical protein